MLTKKGIMKKVCFVAVISVLLCACAGKTGQAKGEVDEQKIVLFNGEDLSNCDFLVNFDEAPAEQVFSVQDGLIHIAGSPFGYMYTKEQYGDYKLHVEWRWPDGPSNSGIFLLIAEPNNPLPNGIECQLQSGNAGDFIALGGSDLLEYVTPEGQERPMYPGISKQNESSENPVGEWNEADIEVMDGVITVYINGVLQNKGTNVVKQGHIGLQSEGHDIEFRNVYLTK